MKEMCKVWQTKEQIKSTETVCKHLENVSGKNDKKKAAWLQITLKSSYFFVSYNIFSKVRVKSPEINPLFRFGQQDNYLVHRWIMDSDGWFIVFVARHDPDGTWTVWKLVQNAYIVHGQSQTWWRLKHSKNQTERERSPIFGSRWLVAQLKHNPFYSDEKVRKWFEQCFRV